MDYKIFNVRMSLKEPISRNKDGRIEIKWEDNKIKIIENYDFIFTVQGVNNAFMKSILIYNLNKDIINKVTIEENTYYNNEISKDI